VDRRGFVAKVSDFGLSQLQPDKSPCHNTASAAVEAAGTVTHMAPEMIAHGAGSCASDVYSFAILGEQIERVSLRICPLLLQVEAN
jgi:serine/threonine protein kinase